MSHFDLLNLPDIVLEKILLNLSYDEIARFRLVSKRFDSLCKKLLNKGFIAAERFHAQSIKAVKVQLPRRESERRLHPLARHCDILSAIETRISMLSMTFMKYVDVDLCCFIPGKVIDEIFRVLKYLKNCRSPPRAHEMLQELRDISSMAMEHFDEKIAPDLKNARSAESYSSNPFSSQCGSFGINSSRPYFTQEKLRLEFRKNHHRTQRLKKEIQGLRNVLRQHKKRINVQAKILTKQAVLIAEQDTQIGELKRTLTEWDHKYGDLIAFNKSSQEISFVKPCSSRVNSDLGKRKLNDTEEASKSLKKSKLGKIIQDVPADEFVFVSKEDNNCNATSLENEIVQVQPSEDNVKQNYNIFITKVEENVPSSKFHLD